MARRWIMQAFLFLDRETQTKLAEDLKIRVLTTLKQKGYPVEIIELDRNNAYPCLGCFQCLNKHAGECVSRDMISEIKKKARTSDLTVFLTPVLFGHFSSPVKNALDRGARIKNYYERKGHMIEKDTGKI
jgi:multimeric flavodoxin WrbA